MWASAFNRKYCLAKLGRFELLSLVIDYAIHLLFCLDWNWGGGTIGSVVVAVAVMVYSFGYYLGRWARECEDWMSHSIPLRYQYRRCRYRTGGSDLSTQEESLSLLPDIAGRFQ